MRAIETRVPAARQAFLSAGAEGEAEDLPASVGLAVAFPEGVAFFSRPLACMGLDKHII